MRPEEQNQAHQAHAETQSANNSIAEPKSVPDSDAFCCPECGGTRIRKRSNITWFLIAIAGLAVLMLLRNILVHLPLKSFMLILSFGLVFLLCVISAAVWLLLFRKSRCKSCGHSFRSLTDSERKKTRIPFPWRFCILNCILLFFLGLTSPGLLEVLFLEKFVYFLIKIAFVIFFCGQIVIFSLLYQAVIHTLLRDKIRSRFLWAILFLVPVILLGSYDLYNSLPRVRAARILSYKQLADLPSSATDVKVYGWSFFFSAEDFLRFNATAEDIDKFLNNSPSLKNRECVRFSPEKMRLPSPEDREKWNEYYEAGHEMYFPDSRAPEWYKQEIRGRARGYGVPPVDHHYNGEVIVDDEKNIVYIKIIWS